MEPVWYYVVNGVQSNPVSFAELKEAAATGKLSRADLVWQEGTPDWVAARTVAGLFSAAPVSPPSPPAVVPVSEAEVYSLSPQPSPLSTPSVPTHSAPLTLDEEPERIAWRKAHDINAPPEQPEWVKLTQTFARRAFNPDSSASVPTADEETTLTAAGMMDATARKFAVWRRAVLFVAAVPCAVAALFGLISVIAMEKAERDAFNAFGMIMLYVQAFALFALPVAAVYGALAYERLAESTKWVLIGGLVSMAVPLAVAFVPGEWLSESKYSGAGGRFGILFIALIPMVLALLPAVACACVRMKLLLVESLVPGWCFAISAPLCTLLTLTTFVMLYQMVGNALLLVGLVLWVAAPLLYLTKFDVLTRSSATPADRTALASTSLRVLGLVALGMAILLIYLFTAKFGDMTLMGFDSSKSLLQPWSVDFNKVWIEYVGRTLFLTVFFADIVLRIVLAVCREQKAFAGSPDFDRTMTGLGSAVLPRGNTTPPLA